MHQPQDYYDPDSRFAEAVSPRCETVCYLCGERIEHCECESQEATWRIRVMESE